MLTCVMTSDVPLLCRHAGCLQDDMEKILESQELMKTQMHTLRQRVKALTQQNARIESMLLQLMVAQGVEVTEEDHVDEEH